MILKRKNALNGPGESTIMHKARKIAITDLNQHLTCVLCSGYFIDATTIIECLHSFCRSCIVKYLEKNKYCPICDVQVHKTKPLLNIRADQTLQDIVYKLVPRLFHNEMLRRREFYACHPEVRQNVGLEQKGEAVLPYVLTPDETMCLSLEYHNNNNVDAASAEAISQGRRYLRCPAAVSVGHLQKLLRSKYDLSDEHLIEILHNQDVLNTDLTLMDLAYIYLWRRKGPLHLTYRIYESISSKVRIKLEVEDQVQENQSAEVTGDCDSRIIKKEDLNERPLTVTAKTNDSENNNQDWKEVQLQISENGIMSITGISEQPEKTTVEVKEKAKSAEVSPQQADVKSPQATSLVTNKNNNAVKELPPNLLNNKATHNETTPETKKSAATPDTQKRDYKIGKHKLETVAEQKESKDEREAKQAKHNVKGGAETKAAANAKCEVSKTCLNNATKQTAAANSETAATKPQPTSVSLNSHSEMSVSTSRSAFVQQPAIVLNSEAPPPTATLNNSTKQLQSLSHNHPLKIHSNVNKLSKSSLPPVIITTVSSAGSRTAPLNSPIFSKPQSPSILNRLQPQPRPGTPITAPINNKYVPPKVAPKNGEQKMFNPVLSVPKLVNLTAADKAIQNKSALSMKKPAATYKTLREPPKAWSPLPAAKSNFPAPNDTNNCSPTEKQAKFFKMRNNIPRYLGNPASGVKPMYPCNKSPTDKKADKATEGTNETKASSSEKLEIKKHSVVTIDPKTLKPIMEKAPENSSLTEPPTQSQPEMRINQSSVPIFNRTQKLQTSPKNERKSPQAKLGLGFLDVQTVPKSPRESSTSISPRLNSKSPNSASAASSKNSPPAKKDKPNLNFTPPNPFIPNLASPNMNPNQFLYPSFSPYDPRVINAYQSLNFGLLYGQSRLPFPGSAPQTPQHIMSTLNLEISKNIRASKNYNLVSAQQLSPHGAYAPSKPSPQPSSQQRKSLEKEAGATKTSDKTDKSLHSAVEKLTVEAKNKVQQLQQNQCFNVEKLVSTTAQKPAAAQASDETAKQSRKTVHATETKKDGAESEAKRAKLDESQAAQTKKQVNPVTDVTSAEPSTPTNKTIERDKQVADAGNDADKAATVAKHTDKESKNNNVEEVK